MPANNITRKRAMNLIWNFHNKPNSKKSTAVSFNIKELQAYLDQCLDDGNDEVKIYFGRYAKDNTPDSQADYDMRQTVVFVPLKNGEENISLSSPALNEGQLFPPGINNINSLIWETEQPGFDPTIQ